MTMVANWESEDLHLIAETAYELHLQGKHAEALTIIEGVLTIDPSNIYALDAAAALSLTLRRPKDALDYASTLLNIAPDHNQARARRCEANILLGRLQYARYDVEKLNENASPALYLRVRMRLRAVSRMSTDTANSESFAGLSAITR